MPDDLIDSGSEKTPWWLKVGPNVAPVEASRAVDRPPRLTLVGAQVVATLAVIAVGALAIADHKLRIGPTSTSPHFQTPASVVVLGIISGLIYGLLAATVVAIHRKTGVINLGGVAVGTAGASTALWVGLSRGANYWPLALTFALVAGIFWGIVGVVTNRRLGAYPQVISGLTVAMVPPLVLATEWLNQQASIGQPIPSPSGFPTWRIGALQITPAYSAALILALPMLLVLLAAGRWLSTFGTWTAMALVSTLLVLFLYPSQGFIDGGSLVGRLVVIEVVLAAVAAFSSPLLAVISGVAYGVWEQISLWNYPARDSAGLWWGLAVLGFIALLGWGRLSSTASDSPSPLLKSATGRSGAVVALGLTLIGVAGHYSVRDRAVSIGLMTVVLAALSSRLPGRPLVNLSLPGSLLIGFLTDEMLIRATRDIVPVLLLSAVFGAAFSLIVDRFGGRKDGWQKAGAAAFGFVLMLAIATQVFPPGVRLRTATLFGHSVHDASNTEFWFAFILVAAALAGCSVVRRLTQSVVIGRAVGGAIAATAGVVLFTATGFFAPGIDGVAVIFGIFTSATAVVVLAGVTSTAGIVLAAGIGCGLLLYPSLTFLEAMGVEVLVVLLILALPQGLSRLTSSRA